MSNNLRSEESGNSELHTSGEPLDSTKQENYTCKPAQNLNTAKGNPERLLKGSQKHSAKTRPEFQNRKQVRPKHNVTGVFGIAIAVMVVVLKKIFYKKYF
jgi:hypothetical protein